MLRTVVISCVMFWCLLWLLASLKRLSLRHFDPLCRAHRDVCLREQKMS